LAEVRLTDSAGLRTREPPVGGRARHAVGEIPIAGPRLALLSELRDRSGRVPPQTP